MQKRIVEIDGLFQKLYEDNAAGKITDERYETLSFACEREQTELREKAPVLEEYLTTASEKSASGAVYRKGQEDHAPDRADTGKITVSEARYLDNRRVQIVDIYYKGVGMIRGFSPEELEEIFQEGESCEESESPTQQERRAG